MKVAALDLGSNTFLCLIAEVENQQITAVIADQVEVVRLGQGLGQTKKFHPEALLRADLCLARFAQLIQRHRPEKILAMATSAARDAQNREELFSICQKHQIPVEIIPGEKEASITYQGATSAIQPARKNLLVLDIGGGSTEFIFGQDRRLIKGESYDVGCVRLTEKFILDQPTPNEQIEKAMAAIEVELQKAQKLVPDGFSIDEIIAVAGTPTSIVAAHLGGAFEAEKIDGFDLSLDLLTEWRNKLVTASVAEKIGMGIPAGRADIILVGVLILLETLRTFKKQSMRVSTRGVRYGVALEMDRRYNVSTSR